MNKSIPILILTQNNFKSQLYNKMLINIVHIGLHILC